MDDQNQIPPSEGTTKLNKPRLCFGNECLEDNAIEGAETTYWKDENVLFSSASVRGVPPEDLRWDYRAATTLFESEELIHAGLCIKSTAETGDSMEFTLRSALWELEQTTVKSIEIFGMSSNEIRHWFLRLAGQDVNIPIENPDNELRPFLYAVPLKGLTATGEPKSFFVRDFGVATGEYDEVFTPILAQSNYRTITSVWDDEVPKAWGVVYARELLEAEGLALARAKFTADLIGFALRTGISHFESCYEIDPLSWDAEVGRTPVTLHPYIIIREYKEAKGWIRPVPLVESKKEINIGDCYERIEYFAERFVDATQAGDFFDQVNRRPLSKRERKLSTGIQRSLRWQAIASDEEDLCDRFIATWIALEAILDAVEYPGVFKKGRRSLRDQIEPKIDELPIPEKSSEPLAVSKEMLRGRMFNDNWPLSKKLELFVKVFGVNLRPGDIKLVRDLNRVRGVVLHAGHDSPDLHQEQLQRLRYLVERLVVAASIFGYEDLEDERHKLQFGQIGPEGGAAPLFLNGREVPYKFHGCHDPNRPRRWEFIIDGKIFNEKNADLALVAKDQD